MHNGKKHYTRQTAPAKTETKVKGQVTSLSECSLQDD